MKAFQPQSYFFKLSFDDTVYERDQITVIDKDIGKFNVYRFFKGQWIDDWPPDIVFYYNKEVCNYDYLVGGAYWELVSEKFRQVFINFSLSGVQFLPIKTLHKPSNKEIGKFWAMNVMNEIEALDWERTLWTTTNIHEIEKYPTLCILREALIKDVLEGVDIFRLRIKQKGGFPIFISEQLKKELEKAQAAKGFSFLQIPAY